VVPFESLGFLFAFHSNFRRYSVKVWRDLEKQVKGRSRSLKMVPFDRPYATFYWLAIVNIALSCTILKFFDVE